MDLDDVMAKIQKAHQGDKAARDQEYRAEV